MGKLGYLALSAKTLARPIRHATPADAAAIAKIHVLSWQQTYRGIVPDSYLDAMSVPSYEATWQEALATGTPHVLLAEEAGEIIGFSSFGACRDKDAKTHDGEIWSIYLLPSQCGKGFGRTLLAESCRLLQAQGKVQVSLWVILANKRAVRFYQAAGFRPDINSATLFHLAGADIPEMRYIGLPGNIAGSEF